MELLPAKPKRSVIPIALWLLSMLLLPGDAPAWGGGGGAKHDRRQEVEQVEREWRRAELAGDAAAMDRMLADDYVSVTVQGKVNTKSQQLRRMRERRLVLDRMDLSEVKIRLSGELTAGAVAMVTGYARISGQSAGVSVDGRYRYTQVMHRVRGGTWIITNFEASRIAEPPKHLASVRSMDRAG